MKEGTYAMKKVISFIILGICLIAIGGYTFYCNSITKNRYNDDYVNGNTAGNLYNSGLFCEYDGIVYFANPNDGYQLYQMNADGTDIQKICNDSAAFINVDENYIYYTRTGDNSESQFSFLHVNTHSLCRIRRDGKGDVLVLDTAPSMYASLVGNYIYYMNYNTTQATTLYRVKIDGTEKAQVLPHPYFTCSTNGQFIYYNGISNDHNIYRYDTKSGSQSLLYEGNCWMPIVDGNYVYFMDCEDSYSLARADLATGEKITLTDDWVDCFNVHDGIVYFQRNSSEPALCSVRTDGSDYKVLKEGIFTEINVGGDLLYFKDYSSGSFYKMSIKDGWINVFNPTVE